LAELKRMLHSHVFPVKNCLMLCQSTVTKVVKIMFWLVKSYDFTSQHMLYVLNSLKKSKMGEIGLKSQKSDEIAQNSDLRTDFAIVPKWCAETKFPPGPAVRRLLAVEMHSHASRSSLSSIFSEQIPKITNHKSQLTNTLSFHNSQNTRLILTNP